LSGSTTLQLITWYHIAFVYNYQTQQQILYVNGVQDAIKSNAAAYQGTNGSIQIGSTQAYSTTNYFNGYIDNLNVSTVAKSATDILTDGSLVVYYSFDLPNPSLDNGPNRLNGTAVNTVTIPGRVNQAIRIIASAYFQIYGVYNVPYGVNNTRSFSISMWIYPTVGNSSTFVQLFSTTLVNNQCVNLLGIYSPFGSEGQIVVQTTNSAQSVMTGPYVVPNNWTHVSLTFSTTNGYTLYTNGIAFAATGPAGTFTTSSSNSFAYLFVGYYSSCSSSVSSGYAYQGSIDELYLHNRELTQADITGLANP
jgi:hypothetical protein